MTELQISDLTPALGAEITGLDLRADLDEATRRRIKEVFDRRAVLVFRGVDVDFESQLYLVETLHGAEPVRRDIEDVNFSYVSNREPDGGAPYGRLMFHTDMMWSPLATQVASLYATEVEEPSVPTVFASTAQAWATLPDGLPDRLEGLHALHSSGQQGRVADDDGLLQPKWTAERTTTAPVAVAHHRTGDIMLYVCEQQTRHIVELPEDQSDALLDELFAHLYAPGNLYEHHWRTGDLVIWDNQLAQHARPYLEPGGPARTLRKVHAPRNLVRLVGKPEYDRVS